MDDHIRFNIKTKNSSGETGKNGSVQTGTMNIADMRTPLPQGPSRGTAGQITGFLYEYGN